MNNLNVFKWYYYPKRRIYKNFVQFFRNLKWAWQRATKGYADIDAWNLDSWLSALLADAFITLRDQAHGYPYGSTLEEWKSYLTEISRCFSVYNEEWENPIDLPPFSLGKKSELNGTKLYEYEVEENRKQEYEEKALLWKEKELERSEYVHKQIEKGFNMIANKFEKLWY